MGAKRTFQCIVRNGLAALAIMASVFSMAPAMAESRWGNPPGPVAVGSQYDTTHVYIHPADFDAFVDSFINTFGGKASQRLESNVMPVMSSALGQYVWTPHGTLSVFAFKTPIPWPFGQERNGYLVTNIDEAVRAARDAGAEVIVEPFIDPIGRDAVIQFPGGVKLQLYWHFTAPSYQPLSFIPDNRVYVSADRVDDFVKSFLRFSHGKVVSDEKKANGLEIGSPGKTYRRLNIESDFGKMRVLVTNGHLPFPFGHETTGYHVGDLNDALGRATRSGARVLWGPFVTSQGRSAMVEFPGGYIAEIHDGPIL